ncbi:MAG: V-type ATP synthase subunit E [Clostridia bacterium]|nr:V-type ATP synthase subunit E [Clostridia bacterium]
MADASNLEKIIKEINRAADSQVSKIKKETASYLRTELRKAETQAKQEISAAQFTVLDKLTEQMNADLAASEKEETQALLRRRAEITDEVFSEARSRLIRFTESDEYIAFLQKSAKTIRSAIGEGSVFYLRSGDEKHYPALREFCAEIRADKNIAIGGIRAENRETGLTADDTLDMRLSLQKQRFYEESGLSVTI